MLSERDQGVIVGLLVCQGSFGGDGRQPHVTLKMHIRHESLLRWLEDRVPGSRLYGIDYASPEFAADLNARTPLRVALRRASGRELKEVVDSFAIRRVEDGKGQRVPANQLRLRLQTIDNAAGYWLDTGILLKT